MLGRAHLSAGLWFLAVEELGGVKHVSWTETLPRLDTGSQTKGCQDQSL